jgi:hypothetical protein
MTGDERPPAGEAAGEAPPPEIKQLVDEIVQGRDKITVPEELLADREPEKLLGRNLQAEIQLMSVGQRLKLALKGNRDARAILIRDSSHMVRRFVLSNPRVSDDEIVGLAKNRSIDREILEVICKHKGWLSNYQVKLALATNPKTPLPTAVRLVPSLLPRDLRAIAKSKNVPGAITGMAKRLVLNRGG